MSSLINKQLLSLSHNIRIPDMASMAPAAEKMRSTTCGDRKEEKLVFQLLMDQHHRRQSSRL